MAVNHYENACISGGKRNGMRMSYLQHLKSSLDLETTYEATRAGFVKLALERNRRATPFVAKARALNAAASTADNPTDLLKIAEIQPALLAAAGISDKAAGHLSEPDKHEAIQGLIDAFLEPAGQNFVEELVFRFLLTRGDTLGGSMRNIGGFMAQQKITRAVIACLGLAGHKWQWRHENANVWSKMPENDADIERQVYGLSWRTKKGPRSLIYKSTLPFLKSNVDISLYKCSPDELAAVAREPSAFLALGELKGGIDPAGADEHWKTARSAMNRIHAAFSSHGYKPHTFFIGAAIAKRMATEIWEMLEGGILENAGNLTNDRHVATVTRWLCGL